MVGRIVNSERNIMDIKKNWTKLSDEKKEELIFAAPDELNESESQLIISLGLQDSNEELVQSTIEMLQGLDDEELQLFIPDLLKLLYSDEETAEQVEFLLEDSPVTVEQLKKADIYNRSKTINLDKEEVRFLDMLNRAITLYNKESATAEVLSFYINPENGYLNISISDNSSVVNAPDMNYFAIVEHQYSDWSEIYYDSPAPIIIADGKEYPVISKANEIFERPFNGYFQSFIRQPEVQRELRKLNRSLTFRFGFQFLDSIHEELISL